MKAKFVNKFERGLDPKEAMGIGDKYEQNFKKIETKINDVVQEAFDLGVTFKDIEEIFYGATHINTSYSDQAYLNDPNNF
jgi:hypothetical protein